MRTDQECTGVRRIHARVVTQSMEGDGMDSLWRAMNAVEGGQGTSAEAKEVRESGGEKEVHVGVLWTKARVYEVVWEHKEAENGSTAREAEGEGSCRGAQVRVSVRSERGHSVASGRSRLSTCGAGSVGSTEGNGVEQQRKAAWAWKRREEALEGAREKTGDGVLIEHIYGKDVNTLWEVSCALEGRPNSEEEVQRIRQGVATRAENRHNMGEMEDCLPREERSWQRYIQQTRQGRRMGGPPEVEAWAAEGGYKVAVYRETRSGDAYRKLVEYGNGTPAGFGNPVDQAKSLCRAVGC